jgi:hypothetical protein
MRLIVLLTEITEVDADAPLIIDILQRKLKAGPIPIIITVGSKPNRETQLMLHGIEIGRSGGELCYKASLQRKSRTQTWESTSVTVSNYFDEDVKEWKLVKTSFGWIIQWDREP